ncbi:polyphosphate:AMP phosphotransferase [Pseudoflavonifractor phocaeensis]|uniref:polyphosphate:AMP phosphotransferase n=1 Tax=Pseudoflavonifractor phocaeensis TaxID=1870988 RepID=UPI00195ADC12|nr:polyphosphate:AMP phosphotransferase [Pseudoflavonifractor phocaeensis]MBM6927258.1 polyphosphate:AMP phosphotransferase [Pseudoflavonifractor phocaeensis]
MLQEFVFGQERRTERECKSLLKVRREELAALQQRIKQAGLPVIVLLEGWSASGKGRTIQSLIRDLDPRFFRVLSVGPPTPAEQRWPFLKRHFECIPEGGKVLFLDTGWMEETVRAYLRGDLSDQEYQKRLESINIFERQLTAGGYLLIKIFLHIDAQCQKERLDGLAADKETLWRVNDEDRRQNKNYEKNLAVFDSYLEATDKPWAPWKVIDSTVAPKANLAAADWVYQQTTAALESRPQPVHPEYHWDMAPPLPLAQADLTQTLEEKEYRKQLKKCRAKLAALHNELYRKKVPVVIAYEGWDAAGKGGNIKRLASALDPRGYEVLPIAAPTRDELARHYLWRFWTRLPKTGHIAIFDRSWYGRVMVERLEGFCSTEDWQRAYDEINEFEKELVDSGMVVLKFWVQIDKDTQLARFNERQADPAKQWKITEEDWRNREKWDAYETAINEMLARTSTTFAPWHVLESVDKRFARIKAMKIVIEAIEQAL